MKRGYSLFCKMAFLVLATSGAISGQAQPSMPGGSNAAPVTKPEVMAAAIFAIQAEALAMKEKKDAPPAKIELIKILSAEEQVVAGMNYRLKLKVKLNGKEREADAVVWWQAWRTPAPYQLTSWNWK